MNYKEKCKLDELIVSYKYKLTDAIVFSISKSFDKWVVARDGIFYETSFSVSDDTKYGGKFNTLEKAQEELLRIVKAYAKPITNRCIRHYFPVSWVRKEEQSKELHWFKMALLVRDWEHAAKIYNKQFSGWTREAISDYVHYQVCINIK